MNVLVYVYIKDNYQLYIITKIVFFKTAVNNITNQKKMSQLFWNFNRKYILKTLMIFFPSIKLFFTLKKKISILLIVRLVTL